MVAIQVVGGRVAAGLLCAFGDVADARGAVAASKPANECGPRTLPLAFSVFKVR